MLPRDSSATAFVGRHAGWLGLTLLLVYAAASSLAKAARRSFWYDEICTIAVVSQGTIQGIWNALIRGADTQPPIFFVIEGFARNGLAEPHVAYRLPSIVAFVCVPVALYLYGRRSLGTLAALTTALVPLLTSLYGAYAIEARPYSLVTASLAFAILLWGHAEFRGRWALLSLALMSATSLHYYAVFALPAFALAEAVRTYRTRAPRPSTWLAILGGTVPLALFWPLLAELKRLYGAHFWARPSLGGIPFLYDSVLALPSMGFTLAVSLAIGLIAIQFRSTRRAAVSPRSGIAPEEIVLAIGFMAIPFIGYVTATLSGGGLTARYVLPSILGVSLAFGYLSASVPRTAAAWMLAVLALTFAVRDVRFWTAQPDVPAAVAVMPSELRLFARLRQQPELRDLPLVVSDGMRFLPLAYYSALTNGAPVVALVDPQGAVSGAGSDSVDVALSVLARYLPLRVHPFADFQAHHSRFILHSSGGSNWDWWPNRLVKDGYSLRLLALEGSQTVYLVEPPR